MSRRGNDLAGKRFGMLTALHKTERRSKRNDIYWLFQCDCGKEIETVGYSVKNGSTYNCGCQTGSPSHRMGHTRTYKIWGGMLSRCRNPNVAAYPNYGGRGITVCERWRTFQLFLQDMGEAPEKLTLERIDTNGDYEPDNCKWATQKEQCNNTRRTRRFNWKGKMRTINEIAELTGINSNRLAKRFQRGFTPEEAVDLSIKRRPYSTWKRSGF